MFAVVPLMGPREPVHLALEDNWQWLGLGKCLFPTFARSIARTSPPLQRAGLERCKEETVELWQVVSYRFPPYTYQDQCLLELEGERRRLNRSENVILAGYLPGHTHAAVSFPEPPSATQLVRLEGTRLSLIRNAFQIGTLTRLRGQGLFSAGLISQPTNPQQIQLQFYRQIESSKFKKCWLELLLTELAVTGAEGDISMVNMTEEQLQVGLAHSLF